jgi:uncharacterized SAM-binding protein YcdF (DUF218 family)
MTLAVIGVALGFLAYLAALASMQPDPEARADAIVALTGSRGGRVETALQLLEEGRGERLLISGVAEAVSADDIRALAPDAAARFECCVDLDRAAIDTASNARETARWAHDHHYRRVLLVTHVYHMPRAQLELQRAAPDVEFIPWPVGDWREPGARWIVLEYGKLLVVMGRDLSERVRERAAA